MCISHFPPFSVFLAIIQVLQCLFLILHVFLFSHHNPGSTVCISHLSRFSVFFAIIQVLQCVFLILHVVQCFLPYSRSCHVSFSFSSFFTFLPYSRSYSVCFLFCTFFCASRHIPGPTVFVAHFPRFLVFSP